MKKVISNKKYLVICTIFVVSLIVIAMSISFAYIKLEVTGDFTESKVESGTFNIKTSLTNTSAINATNMMLIDESEIETKAESLTFTAQADKNKTGKFNIYLKDIEISKGLIDSNFKWQLLMDDEIIGSGSFSDIETKGVASTTNTNTEETYYYDTFYLKEKIDFNGLDESNLEIRIYLLNDNTLNQNNLLNGKFKCRVGIEGYSVK